MATELDIFLTECQNVAQDGISRMESEILSSWDAVFNAPELAYTEYDFTVPSVPTIPTFNPTTVFEELNANLHTGHVWDTQQTTDLWTQISNAIISGGVGISQALQDAIFTADRERKRQTLIDTLELTNSRLAGRGFNMINSILTGARNELIQKYQFDDENQSREIVKLMEEHARLNWQFCIERGIGYEQFQADFTSKYDSLYLESIKTSVDRYRALLQAEIDAFKATLDNIHAIFEINKLKIDAGAMALSTEIEKAKLNVQIAAQVATTTIQSHSAEVSRITQAYAAYSELVRSFSQTAAGGLLTVQTRKLTS